METINHECYVSLEVAKLLREVGFDWKQYSFYNSKGILMNGAFTANWNDIYYMDGGYGSKVSAPTLEVTQRWLREIKCILLYITPKRVNMEWKWDFWYIDLRDKTNIEQRYSTKNFNTFEEAQEAGIKKALEIILEEEE